MAKDSKNKIQKTVSIRNKQAFYQYSIEDTFLAGLVLKGTEIKSIRQGLVNFTDGYCFFSGGALFVKGLHISPYKQASFANHDPDRDKKLLLQKRELGKLGKSIEEKGYTLVPLKLFINDRGFAKLEIGVGKGKKIHDKRESIKEKDIKRELKNF
ncbi:MAG: SsrA-binding protein SmpB [Cyclobacteriaceae bacterium]|nr:SsrA-binding protein SmpB [Cyclobacteriaceae bacterium]